MNNKKIFDRYIDLAEIIGKMFAPFAEVIVHDLRDPEQSIIAIYNGDITGRKVGDGSSDLGLRRINGEVPDKIINYQNQAPNGDKLKSSTLAIRDDAGKIIGSFAVNMNTEYFSKVNMLLNSLVNTTSYDYLNEKEDYSVFSVKDKIDDAINEFMIKSGYLGKPLTTEIRNKLISGLNQRGVLELRGAISIISKRLKISRPTLYKVIKSLRS